MKKLPLIVLLSSGVFLMGYYLIGHKQTTNEKQIQQTSSVQAINLPPSNADFEEYIELCKEVHEYRKERLPDFQTWLEMAEDPNTVILDARSKEAYDKLHIKGAINFDFSDFSAPKLAKVIPSKDTRVLVYCNNNFFEALGKEVWVDNAKIHRPVFEGIASNEQVGPKGPQVSVGSTKTTTVPLSSANKPQRQFAPGPKGPPGIQSGSPIPNPYKKVVPQPTNIQEKTKKENSGPQSVPKKKKAGGETGPAGPQGPQGNPGSKGPQGNPGPKGPQGPRVSQRGPQGNPGPQGPKGPVGPSVNPRGPQANPGPQGPKANPGPQDSQINLNSQGSRLSKSKTNKRACWDLNGNGVGDVNEDKNKDGVFSAADCWASPSNSIASQANSDSQPKLGPQGQRPQNQSQGGQKSVSEKKSPYWEWNEQNPNGSPLALNIPIFINLYYYGYKNLYELGESVPMDHPDLEVEGSGVK